MLGTMKSFAILFFVALPSSCFRLRCYVCHHVSPGFVDADCRDAKDNKLVDCPGMFTMTPSVQKYMTRINFDPTAGRQIEYFCSHGIIQANGAEYVVRECLPNVPDRRISLNEDEDGATGEFFSCSTNRCNNKRPTPPQTCSKSRGKRNATESKNILTKFSATLVTLKSRIAARASILMSPPFENRPLFSASLYKKIY